MRERQLTREEAEQARELNRRIGVLHEAAQLLTVRAAMLEQLAREKHYAEVGPTREADPAAFERADRVRRVAAFLASVALRDAIKDSDGLAALLLGEPTESVTGVDFMEPRLPRQRTGWRPIEERLGI